MLHRVLEAHGGSLPDHVLVSFQNTGKEHLATLDFVRDVQEHWGVPIVWLEYQPDPPGYRIVSHETASRAGEPYEALIVKRKYLPNPVARFCTAELKVRISHKYIRDVKGWEEWDQMVGIRADEQRRASRVRNRPNPEPKAETMIIPLADAGVTVEDVTAFWDSQPFNLGIPTVNGKALLGNCDLCFLKGPKQQLSIIAHEPWRADWWAEMEEKASGLTSSPNGALFRSDRPSYREMQRRALAQDDLFGADEEMLGCFCGD